LRPCASDAEGAAALVSHWAPVFSRRLCDRSCWPDWTSEILPAPTVDWVLPPEDFFRLVRATHDSAPGPDGIPYAAWRALPDSCLHALYGVYLDLLAGAVEPASLNEGLTTFIPKGSSSPHDSSEAVVRPAAATRPITLSNTDAKLLALALNAPLSKVAQPTVHPAQRGFVPGRNIADNILEMDAAA